MRLRVLSSLDIGSCTATMPRSPQAMPQLPIAVSNTVKLWPVIAAFTSCALRGLLLPGNLGLEIVAIHPVSAGTRLHQQHRVSWHPRGRRGAVPAGALKAKAPPQSRRRLRFDRRLAGWAYWSSDITAASLS